MSENERLPAELVAMVSQMDGGMEVLASLAKVPTDPSTYVNAPEFRALTVRDVAIPGPHAEVPGRLYLPHRNVPATALVWAHGGGFASGDLDMPEAHWVGLSIAAAGIPVLSLDYRKCVGGVPPTAPAEDVLAGWGWAVEHFAELGVSDPASIHLGGASAGASLAATVAKRLRDAKAASPASLVLVYPTLHPDLVQPGENLAAATAHMPTDLLGVLMKHMLTNYAGSVENLSDEYAFPGLGDISGLPPVYVLNSDVDLLRASGEKFAAGLTDLGETVTIEYEPDSAHGHLNEPLTDPAHRSIERIVSWIQPSGS